MSTLVQKAGAPDEPISRIGFVAVGGRTKRGIGPDRRVARGRGKPDPEWKPTTLGAETDFALRLRRTCFVTLTGLVLTFALFLSLPFSQKLSSLASDNLLRVSVDLSRPPPPPPLELKPPEEIKPREQVKPELKKEAPRLSLTQLEAALNPGFGGVPVGNFTIDFSALVAEDLTRIFELPEIDRGPQVIYQVAPIYPFSLQRAGVSGSVILRFVVTPAGNVVGIKVVSSTRPEFERPSINAVQQWRFDPGMKNGVKVSVRIEQPVQFTLGGAS